MPKEPPRNEPLPVKVLLIVISCGECLAHVTCKAGVLLATYRTYIVYKAIEPLGECFNPQEHAIHACKCPVVIIWWLYRTSNVFHGLVTSNSCVRRFAGHDEFT